MCDSKDADEYKSLSQPINTEFIKNESNRQVVNKDSIFLYVSSFTANLTYFAYGCNMVWTSPVIAKLKSSDPQENPLVVPATSSEISLIAGLPYFGSIIAPLLLGHLCDIYGRRNVLTTTAAITFVSYLVLAFTNMLYLYYLSRLVLGISQGVVGVVLPIFISEITEKHNRGKFGCLTGVAVVLGGFYGFVVGHYFSVRMFTLMCAAPMIFCVIIMILVVPESPYFLIAKGQTIKAIRTLEKLRNRDDILDDYDEIQSNLKNNFTRKSGMMMTLCKDDVNRRAFAINIFLSILQIMSGPTVIYAFVGPLFDSTNSGLSGNKVAMVVGAVKLIMFLLATSVVESAGRRKMLLISSIGSGITNICLGTYFYMKDLGYTFLNSVPWIPIVLVIAFIVTYSLGLGPVPLVVMSELQPTETKSLAVSLVTSVARATAFGLTAGFPFMADIVGYSGCFWIFGGSCIIGAVFVIFFVIETKGKTLLEIQEVMRTRL